MVATTGPPEGGAVERVPDDGQRKI
jgi:hypothetical protein